jgi:hypothetical protein
MKTLRRAACVLLAAASFLASPAHSTSISIAISVLGTSALTISETLSQSGQFGSILGTYTSDIGELGNATVSAMNVQVDALAARFSLSSTNIGCQDAGYFAGMRSRP